MRLALLYLAAALVAPAQQQPRLTREEAAGNPGTSLPETKPEDLCTLEGKVLNLLTGESVRKASVTLTRTDVPASPNSGPATYSTVSDLEGKFAMKDLEPGKYRMRATRTGFVNMEFGARGQARAGTILSLSRGQHLNDPDYVKPIEGSGEKVSVTENGMHSVQLKLIPADAK